ncbi:response regulator transcription factor [Chroococcidiopsis sp. FACHB-1243]|uniref:response regulator transcription factor n=1 Tax=Chroococcidiopsis sp. [FACHB-1243] TaxID=2692781 RepID=UPI00177B11E6|nr:response regulator transcription factor [Chroococcidiopsis sp. [FACHB-1243]]MBD2306257.1 response regulator transcription factor [Chroococcidiopsis sp. [FACHB-1243]]
MRVLVAATNPIVRAGLESIVRTNPDLLAIGSSADSATLAMAIATHNPDVVLIELSLPEGEPVSEKLVALAGVGELPIAILIDTEDRDRLPELLRSGVKAILPRSASAEEILQAVEAVATGLVVLHPDAIDLLLTLLPMSERVVEATPPLQALTSREIEVLGMLAEGLGNKAIAKRLGISEHTVKFHVSSIFSKLNASSRTEAVTLGARQGLIML